ncbi:MAG: enoyl-CoA hydratase-related protein [Caulobacterales bacterium]
MSNSPALESFRLEPADNGIVHLIFDVAGRSMNVFTNAAIHELAAAAAWLKDSDAIGVLVRSGKPSGFCAGADLDELGSAYTMIMGAPAEQRHQIAFDHFFPLSCAIRALETCGKPVASAITGLALGGGCELALGTHYRVLANVPSVFMGLPESLVGLLPGAGGTQRITRLVGPEASLPMLLDGARLAGEQALAAGLVHALTTPEDAVATAERWLLSDKATCHQPWDVPNYTPPGLVDMPALVAARRKAVFAKTLGHDPSQLAILDCVELGMPLPVDAALRHEMNIFAGLIIRPEPRNMIRSLFRGKSEYEKNKRAGTVPEAVQSIATSLGAFIGQSIAADDAVAKALARAGFTTNGIRADYDGTALSADYWFQSAPSETPIKIAARNALSSFRSEAQRLGTSLSAEEQRQVDYLLIKDHGFPAYLGGAFSLCEDAID